MFKKGRSFLQMLLNFLTVDTSKYIELRPDVCLFLFHIHNKCFITHEYNISVNRFDIKIYKFVFPIFFNV